ncbi:MAG: RdgB/HAM1 family non-canonical purine NTP pyrophosphatase [Burkholderiaceae bacterium]
MNKVVLASNNAGKLAEFSAILGQAGISMVAQGELGVAEAEEPYGTFVENALAKARHASRETGLPALADDSGLCVQALGGAPGVYSARYAARAGGEKSDAANNRHLLTQLASIQDKSACYVAVLVYLESADDPRPIIAEGVWNGAIVEPARGANGFGYDPHFYLPDLGKTAAELPPDQKNALSHRAQALKALLSALRSRRP